MTWEVARSMTEGQIGLAKPQIQQRPQGAKGIWKGRLWVVWMWEFRWKLTWGSDVGQTTQEMWIKSRNWNLIVNFEYNNIKKCLKIFD